MAKPGFYFYPGDWIKDTACLTLEAQAAYLRWLFKLSETGGQLTWPVEAWARHVGIDVYKAIEILCQIEITGVAVVEWICLPEDESEPVENDTQNQPDFSSKILANAKQTSSKTLANVKQTPSKTLAKLYNRRMVREFENRVKNEQLRIVRAAAGQKGGSKRQANIKQNEVSSSSSSSLEELREEKKSIKRKEKTEADTLHAERIEKVISRMNQLSGKNFKTDSKEFLKNLSARLKEHSLNDCLTVVEFMWTKWSTNDDMRQYFDPVVLFRPKNFPRYAQAAIAPKREPMPNPVEALRLRRERGEL